MQSSIFFVTILIITSFTITFKTSTALNDPNATDFIRSNCKTTLYPLLCFHSLAGYANAVQQDPARLARVAIGVSLARAKSTARYIANLTHRADYEPDPRAASAVRDCFSVMSDAVDQIRASLRQMRRLDEGEQLRYELGNVQTWMSAAITNEDTCTDGFDDMYYDDDYDDGNEDNAIKAQVFHKIVKVKEVTSNALALVNGFVAKTCNRGFTTVFGKGFCKRYELINLKILT